MKLAIHTRDVLARRGKPPVGININYLRDADENRPQARPLAEALGAAGCRYLRYPGGGKSDMVLHMTPPFERCAPQPRTETYIAFSRGAVMMDFDRFMATCRQTGCEPHVVVGCDTLARSATTPAQFLENAVEWVRYANIRMGYGVKRWEVGNENWNHKGIPSAEFGEIVCRFSRAMKAVDPTIEVGASGNTAEWWAGFLPVAAADIDFLTVSQYSCWRYMRYEHYANTPAVPLLGVAETALQAIDTHAPSHRDRLYVVISELNSRDYAYEFEGAGWQNRNTLGHALVNMDLYGQLMLNERIAYGMIWNTRWMHQRDQYDDIFYGLDANNGLMPSAMCLYLWGRHMHGEMLRVDCPDGVVGYASRAPGGERLSVLLINKSHCDTALELEIAGADPGEMAVTEYSGLGPDDLFPALKSRGRCRPGDVITLPPVSLTVLHI